MLRKEWFGYRGWCIKNATGQNTLKKIDIFLSFWVAIGHKSNISLDLHTIGHLNTFLGAKYPCVSKLSNILSAFFGSNSLKNS